MALNGIELKRVQNATLYIAKEIKRICDNNQIHYSICGGILIGAIRHKGFIPWDDDIDIMMTRKEYNKFIQCCKTQLSNDFELRNWHETPDYPYSISQIVLKNASLVIESTENSLYQEGIWVDIYAFENVPNCIFMRLIQNFVTFFSRALIIAKAGIRSSHRWSWLQRIGASILGFISKFISKNLLIALYEKFALMYLNETTKFCTCLAGYGYTKETVPRKLFTKYIEIPFEDTTFMAVANYHFFLTNLYGNYMQLPPVEKRVSHNIISVDFGIYQDKF